MVTYNTQKPVGSADPRDLYDNAQVVDEYANSEEVTASDRLGNTRKTIAGIDADARAAIANAGYVFAGDYEAGIELTAYNQVVRGTSGEFWRVSGSEELPYTTTGAGLPEGGVFVTVGDAALRQDLVQPVATFDNVADMRSATGIGVGRKLRTLGQDAPGDGGGADYEAVGAGTSSGFGFIYEELTGSGLEARLLGGGVMEDKTVLIPTDYATLQGAFDYLGKLDIQQGVQITINIESGHLPLSGLILVDKNFAPFIISADDAEVTLDPSWPAGTDFLACTNGRAPTLDCLIDGNGLCRHGVNLQEGAFINVTTGRGVKNVAERGIYLNTGSMAIVGGTVWTGAGSVNSTGANRGAWVTRGSTLIAENADFSDSEGIGIYVSRASTVHAPNVKAENCSDQAVWVHRTSRFTAHSSDATGVRLSNKSGSTFDVVQFGRSSIGSINADQAGSGPVIITQNGTGNGVQCGASQVNIRSSDLIGGLNSGNGIEVGGGGFVNADNASFDGFNDNINANGGNASAVLATIENARRFGVQASRAEINLASASVTGSSSNDIQCVNGSMVRADGCSTTNGSGSPSLSDVNLGAFNDLTGAGVIFV